ncbi:MAG: acyl-homoserine-lactone synthase TraI [Allorhizobium sp.]
MQLLAISTPRTAKEERLLAAQHALRAKVFADRLGWEVDVDDGMEMDRFDDLRPTYILAVGGDDRVHGCARLLPATGPTMIQEIFPSLLPDGRLFAHAAMIESSRFCVDTQSQESSAQSSINNVTQAMFAGIIEWSIVNGFSDIVTVTDLRFERILSRVGWPLQRLGTPQKIGVTTAIAGVLPADRASFQRLQPPHYRSLIATSFHKAA